MHRSSRSKPSHLAVLLCATSGDPHNVLLPGEHCLCCSATRTASSHETTQKRFTRSANLVDRLSTCTKASSTTQLCPFCLDKEYSIMLNSLPRPTCHCVPCGSNPYIAMVDVRLPVELLVGACTRDVTYRTRKEIERCVSTPKDTSDLRMARPLSGSSCQGAAIQNTTLRVCRVLGFRSR